MLWESPLSSLSSFILQIRRFAACSPQKKLEERAGIDIIDMAYSEERDLILDFSQPGVRQFSNSVNNPQSIPKGLNFNKPVCNAGLAKQGHINPKGVEYSKQVLLHQNECRVRSTGLYIHL